MNRWQTTRTHVPAFFQPGHSPYGDEVLMTVPLFVYHQYCGVLPAIGFRADSGEMWWEFFGVSGRVMVHDDRVTHWMLMEFPRTPELEQRKTDEKSA